MRIFDLLHGIEQKSVSYGSQVFSRTALKDRRRWLLAPKVRSRLIEQHSLCSRGDGISVPPTLNRKVSSVRKMAH